jgi:hypothetical protein
MSDFSDFDVRVSDEQNLFEMLPEWSADKN